MDISNLTIASSHLFGTCYTVISTHSQHEKMSRVNKTSSEITTSDVIISRTKAFFQRILLSTVAARRQIRGIFAKISLANAPRNSSVIYFCVFDLTEPVSRWRTQSRREYKYEKLKRTKITPCDREICHR